MLSLTILAYLTLILPQFSAGQDQFQIDRVLEEENQATLRRRSRLFKRSNTTGHMTSNGHVTSSPNGHVGPEKRRFVIKTPTKKPEDLDITKEKLSLEDVECLLLSNADNISQKIKAMYKLVAMRAIETQSRLDP